MKNIVYSPTARDKLLQLKQYLTAEFGDTTSEKVLREITTHINQLAIFEDAGESVKKLFGIDVDYKVLFVAHNYFFYRVDENRIYIVNIYNEREDFMQKLFGIRT